MEGGGLAHDGRGTDFASQFHPPHTGMVYTPPTFSDHVGVSTLLPWTPRARPGRADPRAAEVLTGGGPAGSTESIALYAYLNGMRFLDFGYSATVMLAGFLLLTALILVGTLLLRSCGLLRPLDR